MILEVAILNVIPGKIHEFERDFTIAQEMIASMKGYNWHELHRCIEVQHRYLLLVEWKTLEDHTIGFRQSGEYSEWKKLLHHYYSPFPTVEHYEKVAECKTLNK